MAVAESYINGLEVPDSVLRSLFDTCMPVFFKHFPSLLAPYEWVLTILRTVFGTILQALQGKEHKKVELNVSQGWS
ncbi:Cyclopropane-fatty-acyl-phospholipid synthase [uncultured Microcoleus sp.]|uniref:Cyclopropane-fatty-acyl-phospholipid synthase n=1 Tax=uncultured Microcoleus sp. TaxID=259945 RepID=A0A6J4N0Y9_9CYAN|nr:Cyclopropane-fatty-acyl-phospholipid synthase [uncultured Microcoleus sp.]